mgnify:CR=1 FL=1
MRLKIGKLKLDNPLILAPMHRVNCTAFRILCKQNGAALVTTSMLHALEIKNSKRLAEITAEFIDEEGPRAVQIIGSEPKSVKEAVELIEDYADVIDLNFGCPDYNMVKQKSGAYFSKKPEEIKSILSAAVSATNKPVTAKIRSGWNDNHLTYLKAAKIIEDAGADAITMHARTKEQHYSGKADWSQIKELKRKMNIPVIGNGDIWAAEDAKKMLEDTGCDFVMIARGAIGNPHIFKQSAELILHNRKIAPLTSEEKTEEIKLFTKLYYQYKKKPSFPELKRQYLWFYNSIEGATEKRKQIARIFTKEKLIGFIEKK